VGVKSDEIVRIVLAIAGAILVSVGAYIHYPPLGPIALGSMLYLLAIIGAMRAR
jgi:hypothetical protein